MKTVYACTFVEKTAEEDNYEKGLTDKRQTILWDKCNITAETLLELVDKIKNNFGVDFSYVFLQCDDEPTRFTTNQLENADSETPTLQEEQAWKKGELKLYLCDYSFLIEKRNVEPIGPEEFEQLRITVERGE